MAQVQHVRSSIREVEPPLDPVDLVGETIQPQPHLCNAFCISSLISAKTGEPQFDPGQTAALLTQDIPHVADVRADSPQVFKHKIVDVFSHGSTLT